ncbi:GIY-YIG nuclease family protein [Stenotrophomonas tumulicola]|uniref:GIY-YIG nuclease family protein n=1 Tax=Stenotrophomonas tumulicola TaxID=1685415 RepID=A0A7W3FKZ4_9GAMM|nr:GIY-YIG nuclease family protein [Stenotrophomonas tumulicola]MBA8681375.1 GIY-YIG nuclease family protein [Stenotrophomonas tumulicola]
MARSSVPWFLYLLECRDGSYYAGISTDVQARFAMHLAGKGARYTRSRPPLRIVAVRQYADRAEASRAEWQLKQQPRARKLAWLASAEHGSALPERTPVAPKAGNSR